MKTLENLILGDNFREAASQAVKWAVAEADAADLPKAYEPDFSLAGSAVGEKLPTSHGQYVDIKQL